jgi:diguanylate cyclase (GGDEF)-like protein
VGLLFYPAVAVTGRLRYAQKFVAVGLVLLVPLAAVALIYVDQQRRAIEQVVRERHGVEYIAPLTVLTTHLVEARHKVVLSHGVARPDMSIDLARGDELDRRYGATLRTSEEWKLVRSLINAATHSDGDLITRFQAYNTAADELLGLIIRVGDRSDLTLDTDLDSFYLMDIMQSRLPLLLDYAGRATDRAAFTDSASLEANSDGFIELGVYNGVVSSTHKAIDRAVRTIAAETGDLEVRQVVLDHFGRLDVVTAAFDAQLRATVKNRRVGAALAGGADSVHTEATYFTTDAATAVDRLLLARMMALSTQAHRVEIGGALAATLAFYMFVGFYLSVIRPIRRIVATLDAVAVGDLTQRVAVDTHDELSLVARALNDTIAKTEVATNRLGRQATHDTLTGLPNRAYVLDRLDKALTQTRAGAMQPMAVLFIDLDRFKIINDSLGHAAGDAVLRTVAKRLTEALRPQDLVARLAGDEFVVIAERLVRLDEAVQVGERIVSELCRPITITTADTEREVGVGASIGIAFADGSTTSSPDDLLRDADVAMYQAKERGRGRVEIFDDRMRAAVESRLQIQSDLRLGLQTGQVGVHYQPILDVVTGRVIAFEALARWDHPDRGMIDARELVSVAEETGLISALGVVVLGEACRQAVHWRSTVPGHADLCITVNVSGRQFGEPTFVPTVAAVLADTGLDPAALWLEITESSIMAETGVTRAAVDGVKALGVHLAIDDFGTGYSSLAYLRQFPVSALKIDQSFIAGLGVDPEAEPIVSMIVSLATALRLTIVAEGVETADQFERLRRLGCTAAQGFYLGRPEPAEVVWQGISVAAQRARQL